MLAELPAREQRKVRTIGCTWEELDAQISGRRVGPPLNPTMPLDSSTSQPNLLQPTSESLLPHARSGYARSVHSINEWISGVELPSSFPVMTSLQDSSSSRGYSSSPSRRCPSSSWAASPSNNSNENNSNELTQTTVERYMPPHARPRLSTEIESNGASSKPRGSRKPSPLSSTSVPIILPDLNRQKPSKMAQREHGANRLPADADDHSIRERFGFKRNYNGDVTNPANRPQEVPKELNCNLWVTGLPADCTESDVEAAIGKAGAIFSINLNRPDHAIGHATTAAQVAFMRAESARAFLNDKRKTGLLVRGFAAKVGWNRVRVGPQNETNSMGKLRSRVLVIQGAPSIVNEVSLLHLFRRYFTFFTTSVKIVAEEEDRSRTMEWRFARVAGQADLAAKCLQELIDDGYDIKYRFDKDPCEVNIVSSPPQQCSETSLTAMPRQSACASSHLCRTCGPLSERLTQ